ncbi:MAG TPA: hypothetical protein VM688_05255 [Nocardioidaceae bacterium]|nr:hypothetical protein [Nocardioidaceae bacterium]
MHSVEVPTETSCLPLLDRLTYLLSAQLEDHDLGLWEIVWTLNSVAPEAPLDAKLRLARGAVSRLVGQYDLWRGEWPPGAGPVAPLTAIEMQTLAHDDVPWHDPEHASLLVWLREGGAAAPKQTD